VTTTGKLELEVGPAAGGFVTADQRRVIKAKIKSRSSAANSDKKRSSQHVVPLNYVDGNFVFRKQELDIHEGDSLVFHLETPKSPAFAVQGRIGKLRFSSANMVDKAVFTHAFGFPGTYEWVDANGSGIGGVVTVLEHTAKTQSDATELMKTMENGVLVHIVGDKVDPAEITITVGQTVFFAVEKSSGITITDASLVEKSVR
jgi:plastocyanin